MLVISGDTPLSAEQWDKLDKACVEKFVGVVAVRAVRDHLTVEEAFWAVASEMGVVK